MWGVGGSAAARSPGLPAPDPGPAASPGAGAAGRTYRALARHPATGGRASGQRPFHGLRAGTTKTNWSGPFSPPLALTPPACPQVDDTALNRAVLRRTLESAGAGTVVEAADGAQAFELFTSHGGAQTFGLILMDLRMPVCDGWTAASHIRAWERGAAGAGGQPPACIVACTTEDISAGSPALQRCWDVGMDGAIVSARMRGWAGPAAVPSLGRRRLRLGLAALFSNPPAPSLLATTAFCRARR